MKLRALFRWFHRSPLDVAAQWWHRQSRWIRALVFVVLGIFAVTEPLFLNRYWQSVLFFPVGIYVLLALGLNVVVGLAGLLDLGYVAFYAVGAYTTAVLTTTFGWDVWAALPVAVMLAMFAGVVLGAPTLRLRGDYLAIVTLGFGEIVRIIATNTNALGQSRGIVGIPHPSSLGTVLEFRQLPLPYYYVTLVAVVCAIVMVVRLTSSRVGRSWIALREDEDAAEIMGVHTFTMKLWAFAIGASTGGLGGWIYASKVGFISPDNFPLFLSITILAAVVLGGMGSIVGVVVGGFAVAFLPEYLRNAAAGQDIASVLHSVIGGQQANITEYRVLLFGAALVAMMVLRPQGLVPSRRRAAELADVTPNAELGGVVTPSVAHEVGVYEMADGKAVYKAESLPSKRPEALKAPTFSPLEKGLSFNALSMRFGGVDALKDVSFTVPAGQIFGVIGPNGAGKTTLFNCITGVFHPQQGSITLDGTELGHRATKGLELGHRATKGLELGHRATRGLELGHRATRGPKLGNRAPHHITQQGIARTFQNIRLFPDMSARENVMVGADARHHTSVPGALLGLPRHRREERKTHEIADWFLRFTGIAQHSHELARNLPYGDQRRLEIARALATAPRVLLLDEPAAGMNPSEKQRLAALIRNIRDDGITVILIEHDMSFVMPLCDRICVLDFGQKIAEGTPAEIQANINVIRAYLGVPADAS